MEWTTELTKPNLRPPKWGLYTHYGFRGYQDLFEDKPKKPSNKRRPRKKRSKKEHAVPTEIVPIYASPPASCLTNPNQGRRPPSSTLTSHDVEDVTDQTRGDQIFEEIAADHPPKTAGAGDEPPPFDANEGPKVEGEKGNLNDVMIESVLGLEPEDRLQLAHEFSAKFDKI